MAEHPPDNPFDEQPPESGYEEETFEAQPAPDEERDGEPVDAEDGFDPDEHADSGLPEADSDLPAAETLAFPDEGEPVPEPSELWGEDPELQEWLEQDEALEAVEPEFDAWLRGALRSDVESSEDA